MGDADTYDAVVIGGGFAGSAFATLLRRYHPAARVLVIERNEVYTRKVGEATVEISAFFLHRVLRLYDHLSRQQLPKHGLRYWFSKGPETKFHEMTEVGPAELPHLATFQLDRAVLDDHIFQTAGREGAEMVRPAKVVDVELAWPQSSVTYESAEGRRKVTARWVIDASGRQTFLSRKLKIHSRVDEHPTAAIWARWKGVKDMDGPGIQGPDAGKSPFKPLGCARRLATNHFCDYGWWCWAIPLNNGHTSIGLVYNKELFTPPGDGTLVNGTLREKYIRFLETQPGLRDLIEGAEIVKEEWGEDFMSFTHLPHRTSAYAGKGWALLGDAASFLDPYYSPGLDHASMSVFATMRMVQKDLTGQADEAMLEQIVTRHNRQFVKGYDRWLKALYVGKYEQMGDADLLGAAFLIDTALYYMGVVKPVQKNLENIANPAFGVDLPQATWIYHIMTGITRRLTKLARFRRQTGTSGRHNVGRRYLSRPFGKGVRGSLHPLLQGLGMWFRVELEYLGYRLRHGRVDVSAPVPSKHPAQDPMPMPAAEPA